jgi:glycosyltransferase involved in cell wall biosynthesis
LSLIFVDDGSTDETSTVLIELAEASDAISWIALEQNRGKAEAVRIGLLAALERQPGQIGYWDADLSTPLDTVAGFRALLVRREDVDWVLGSRVRLLGRRIARRPLRHYLGRVFATCASVALGMPVYDTQCGAKLFRVTDDLAALLEEEFISGFAFDVELLARLVDTDGRERASSRIVEFPLKSWRDVPGSKLNVRAALRAFIGLFRIRSRYGR